MKHLAGVLVLAFFALASSSCSLFRTSTQTVTVTATDSSADLFADGQPIGRGVGTATLKRSESHTFMAKTSDGRAGTASVGRSLSTTAMLDIIGGLIFLIPFIGLFGPGAWDLDVTNVVIAVPQK